MLCDQYYPTTISLLLPVTITSCMFVYSLILCDYYYDSYSSSSYYLTLGYSVYPVSELFILLLYNALSQC